MDGPFPTCLGDHPYITSAKELGGWVQKMAVFADVHYGRWPGGSDKVQICAKVIYGWSPFLTY